MHLNAFRIGLLSLALGSLFLGNSATAAPRLLFDASVPAPYDIKVSAPEQKALLNLYLGRGVRACPDNFRVLARFNGRFTMNTPQTAYLVSNCYDDISSNLYRERLAGDLLILNGTKLVYFEPDFADDMQLLPPLDGGKYNYLLTHLWQGPKQGYFWDMADIQKFQGGGFKGVLNLGMVYLDEGKENQPLSRRRVLWFDTAKPNFVRLREFTSAQCENCTTPEAPYQPGQARSTLDVTVDLRNPPKNAKWMEGL